MPPLGLTYASAIIHQGNLAANHVIPTLTATASAISVLLARSSFFSDLSTTSPSLWQW